MTRRRYPPSAEDAAAQYGWVWRLIRAVPELKAIFEEAIASGVYDEERLVWTVPPMSADEFMERIRRTDWYERAKHTWRPGAESAPGADSAADEQSGWPPGWS